MSVVVRSQSNTRITVVQGGSRTVFNLGTPGLQGPGNNFIQPTQPTATGPHTWWDTSGGNLTLWIEDGA